MMALAIFCPPLYFLIQKKFGLFFITLIMAAIGFGLVFFIVPPLILWFIAAIMAIRHCKRQDMQVQMKKHAELVGKEVAANLSRNDKT
jgi:Sec-independent protein secretion pathway component TatC